MKKLLVLMIFGLLLACSPKKQASVSTKPDSLLTVYAYDSFVNSGGLGEKISPLFYEKYKIKLKLVGCGDAGQMLSKAIMEKQKPQADVIVGIDNTFMAKALAESLFIGYEPQDYASIPDAYLMDKKARLIPYDYGYFAFVYDSKKILEPPLTFGQLQDSRWQDKLIFIDPRTSSVGKGLLLWTVAAFGEKGFANFWLSLRRNVLSTPATWDEAYGAFLSGEAPIVLSYSTSPAYHREIEKTERYKAFIPQEGGFRQTEGMGLVNRGNNPEAAKLFIDFMLSPEVQVLIPSTQWMYPIMPSTPLPTSFKGLPEPQKDLTKELTAADIAENSDKWIQKWINAMNK